MAFSSSSKTLSTDSFQAAVRHYHVLHSGGLVAHRRDGSSVGAEQGSAAGSLEEGTGSQGARDQQTRARAATASLFEVATRDLRELSTAHDDQNLVELNSSRGVPIEGEEQVNIQSLKDDLQQIREAIDTLDGLGPKLTKRFKKHIATAERALGALDRQNQNNPLNFAKVFAFSTANTALMSLPWLLATDPLRVKDVAAGESRLSKNFMIIMAGYHAKSVALLLSHMGTKVANVDTMLSFAKERHSYETQSFVTGAPALFSKKVNDAVEGSFGYVVGRAAFAAASMNVVFQSDELGRLGNRIGTGLGSLVTTGSFRNNTAYPRLEAQSAHLTLGHKDVLNDLAEHLSGLSRKLKEVNEFFAEQGRPSGIAWEEHITNARRALSAAAIEMKIAIGEQMPHHENHDKKKKIMFAAVGAIVTAGLLAAVFKDKLAVTDVFGDALFSMPILLINAFDPNVTERGAKDAFKSFMGTSLISAVVLGINAAAGDPIAKSDKAFYALLPIFAALSLTMPSPAVDGLAKVLEKLDACFETGHSPRVEAEVDDGDLDRMGVVPEIASSEESGMRDFDLERQLDNPDGVWPISGGAVDRASLFRTADATTSEPIPELTLSELHAEPAQAQRQEFVTAGLNLLAEVVQDEESLAEMSMAVGEGLHTLLDQQRQTGDDSFAATDAALRPSQPNFSPTHDTAPQDNVARPLQSRLDRLEQELVRINTSRAAKAAGSQEASD